MSLRGVLEATSSLVVVVVGVVWLVRASTTPEPPQAPPEPPLPTQAISLDGALLVGNRLAPVAIVEFADYECTFCGKFSRTDFTKLRSSYIDTGKVLFVFRNYPLGPNVNAKPAAVAVECASATGKGWQMHELLFKEPMSLTRNSFIDHARGLGLSESFFAGCIDNPDRLRKVEADASYAKSLGVRVTPTFFVGHVGVDGVTATARVTGAKMPDLTGAVEAALEERR